MLSSASVSDLAVVVQAMLDQQRRHHERLAQLEEALASRLAQNPDSADENSPASSPPPAASDSADTVEVSPLPTPPVIGWPKRQLPPGTSTTTVDRAAPTGTKPPPPASPKAASSPPPQAMIRSTTPATYNETPTATDQRWATHHPSPESPAFPSPSSATEDRKPAQGPETRDGPPREWDDRLAASEARRRLAEEKLRDAEVRLQEAQQRLAALQAQLRQAQRLETLGRLVAGIAHDFNNVLTTVTGHAELLKDRLPPSDAFSRDALEQILDGTRSAASLTRRLLHLASPGSTTSSGELAQEVNLNELLRRMERFLRRLLGEAITLSLQPAGALDDIRADPLDVERAIVNLAVNARDAIGERGGTIVIRTANTVVPADRPGWPAERPPGPYVTLTVSDDGCGMTEEVKAQVGQPFFTTKPAGQGYGLGLTSVREAMDRAGGHLEIESAFGWGTSVRLFWPRHREHQA